MLAALRASAGAGALGRGSGAIAALRGAGAAVLSAQARPYLLEPTDDGSVVMPEPCEDAAQLGHQQDNAKDMKTDLKCCMEGSAPRQLQAQAEQQETLSSQTDALVGGTTPYHQAQAKQLDKISSEMYALRDSTTWYQKAQAEDLKTMSREMDALRDGTTWYQKAQAKQLGRQLETMSSKMDALRDGTTWYQQEQAEKLKSLDMWRASIVACTKATALLVLTGCAYVNLFM